MIDFITLSFKELRNMKRELMIIFGVIICVLFYAYLIIGDLTQTPLSQFEYYVARLLRYVYYIIPALFVYSLYKSETNANAPRNDNPRNLHTRIFIMYLLYVEMLIIMAVVFHVVISNFVNFGDELSHNYKYFIISILRKISGPFIMLSLICSARGVMFYVQRYKYLSGIVVVSVGMFVYHLLNNKIWESGLVNTFDTVFTVTLFTIPLGSIFCAVGIKLIKVSDSPARTINE